MLLHQQLCPEKKGYFARNVTIKISSNLHSICLQFPSMCVVDLRMNRGSSSDENSISEYTSNKKGRTYEGLCFCTSSCAQKKRLVCSTKRPKFPQIDTSSASGFRQCVVKIQKRNCGSSSPVRVCAPRFKAGDRHVHHAPLDTLHPKTRCFFGATHFFFFFGATHSHWSAGS